tara:strand:- start:3052 stop:3483 length:432 start_codon:yes stop_codon:yes gene_type:complete
MTLLRSIEIAQQLFKENWKIVIVSGLVCGVAFIIAGLVLKYKLEQFTSSNTKDTSEFKMFYVNWCPHCVNAKPEFEQLAKKYKRSGAVKITMIDSEQNPESAKAHNVEGYPTFILTTGSNNSAYNGSRDFNSFDNWLKATLKL